MATFHGNDGTVDVGSNTLAEIVSWDLTMTMATADDSAMGDTWTTHQTGKKSASGTITCHWDDTDADGQQSLGVGSSVTLNLGPEGGGSGDYEYSFTATIVSEAITVTHDGINQRVFGFEVNGAVTEDTFA